MPLTQSTRDGHVQLLMSGGCTIFEAAEYKPQLLSVLDGAEDVLELDLSGVNEIDTSGLQLLLMMRREAAGRYKQLVFSEISPAIQALVDMLRLHDRFGVPSPMAQEQP